MIVDRKIKHKKLLVLSINLLLISFFFILIDLSGDIYYGQNTLLTTIEALSIIFLILTSCILLFSFYQENATAIDELEKDAEHLDALEAQNTSLKEAMTKKILDAFKHWGFTKSETEIGLLLIKGFSSQEIANIRNASEGTVRKQAVEIYRKSNTNNRAEFVAYFIEDLMG